jgi:DNA primase
VNTEAYRYYREQLLTSPAAQGPCRYLAQRRLTHVLAADSPWPVGYAPAAWTSLTEHLNEVGFSDQELVAAGVACRTRQDGIVDRFRDRIMLAQRNQNADVVGFIGRAAPGAPTQAPKYLNSPRTDIYNKRELLFGLFENSDALENGCRPVLVEGPLDVLAISVASSGTSSHAAGVAPCGTALTREHVDLLVRHVRPGVGIVAAYDNDPAGRAATAAAYELLTERTELPTHALLAATLPRGTDPAELLQVHGPAGLGRALTGLQPLVERAIDARLEPWGQVLDGIDGRIAAVKDVAPLIGALHHSQVAQQVNRLATATGLDPATVTIAVTDALTCGPFRRGRDQPCRQGPLAPLTAETARASPGLHL